MMDGHDEGMSTGGPVSDGGARSSMATPPLTDGHPMPPDTDQVCHCFLSLHSGVATIV